MFTAPDGRKVRSILGSRFIGYLKVGASASVKEIHVEFEDGSYGRYYQIYESVPNWLNGGVFYTTHIHPWISKFPGIDVEYP